MSEQFSKETTIQEIAAAYPEQINGRTFLITGATSGLGLELSKFLAKSTEAGTVILTGRSAEKLAKSVSEVEAARGGKATIIKSVLFDLADVESVKRGASEVNKWNIKIDYLINNAAIMAVPFKKILGYESQFVVNYLSQFLFTNLILESLSQGARIVNVTSGAYLSRKVILDDINFKDGAAYNGLEAYGQSKSAKIMFSKELTRRYFTSKGIESVSVHPGAVLGTNIGTHTDPVALGFVDKEGNVNPQILAQIVSMDQGIGTLLHAAISPWLKGRGGVTLGQYQAHETGRASSEEENKKLWELSNEILGTQF